MSIWSVLCVFGVLAPIGCTKSIPVGVDDVDLGSGAIYEVTFTDGSELKGRLVRGSAVSFSRNDSLFAADVDDFEDNVIELSRQVLLTDLNEWSALQKTAARSEAMAERPEIGGATLFVDDVESVELIISDNRRTVTQSVFWVALAVTLGFAASR